MTIPLFNNTITSCAITSMAPDCMLYVHMQYLISVLTGFMVFRQAQGYLVMARQEVLYVRTEFSEDRADSSGLMNWLWGLQGAVQNLCDLSFIL